jgi:hypothetical protein
VIYWCSNTPSERASCFLQYITDALREFAGTPEEVRVTIADCQMAIARGDVEGALKRLRKIPPTSPHFPKARMAMADIYLKYRRDKAAYIKCYMDLKVGPACLSMLHCPVVLVWTLLETCPRRLRLNARPCGPQLAQREGAVLFVTASRCRQVARPGAGAAPWL